MLMRPVCSRQSRATQAAACGCFVLSRPSRAYTRTLVSTKTSAVMQFLSRCLTLPHAPELDRRFGQVCAHRVIVFGEFVHPLRQHFADQTGQTGVVLGGVDAG